jgi:hypothetical protein
MAEVRNIYCGREKNIMFLKDFRLRRLFLLKSSMKAKVSRVRTLRGRLARLPQPPVASDKNESSMRGSTNRSPCGPYTFSCPF